MNATIRIVLGLLPSVLGTPAHAESPAINTPPEIQARPSAVIERSVIEQPAIISPPINIPAEPASEPVPAHKTDTDQASVTPSQAAPAPRSRPRKPPIAKPDPLNAAINLANTQFNAQQYAQVIDTLHAHDAALFQKRDIDSARLLGWAAYHTANWTLARLWFTRAANWSNQADDIANIVRVELAEQQFERAQTLLARLLCGESVPPDYLFCSRVWQRVAGSGQAD